MVKMGINLVTNKNLRPLRKDSLPSVYSYKQSNAKELLEWTV